jgi:hypothetical protein
MQPNYSYSHKPDAILRDDLISNAAAESQIGIASLPQDPSFVKGMRKLKRFASFEDIVLRLNEAETRALLDAIQALAGKVMYQETMLKAIVQEGGPR